MSLEMTNIFLISGPPCSGKTTYATDQMSVSDMIVDIDFITKALTNKYLHNRPKYIFPFVLSARDAIYKRMESPSSVDNIYVTATMPKAEDREKFSKKYNAKIILLLPSKDECLERLYNDEQRTEDIHEELNDAIEKWYEEYTESDKDIVKNYSNVFYASDPPWAYNQQKGNTMNSHLTIPLEIKALNKREFEGHGSVFGNKDYGNDVVLPGAFKRTLAEHKSEDTLPMMFWMHDPSRIPGKWLDMKEDDTGLYVKGVLADTDLGNEIHTLLGMKAVRGLSIGYTIADRDYDDEGTRLLKDVDLWETSIVSLAMNPKAQIAHAKSRLSERGENVFNGDELAAFKRDLESYFRNKGFSKNLAKMYVGNVFKDQTGAMPDDPDAMSEDELLASAYEELELQDNAGEMPSIVKQLESMIEDQKNYKLVQEMRLRNL